MFLKTVLALLFIIKLRKVPDNLSKGNALLGKSANTLQLCPRVFILSNTLEGDRSSSSGYQVTREQYHITSVNAVVATKSRIDYNIPRLSLSTKGEYSCQVR